MLMTGLPLTREFIISCGIWGTNCCVTASHGRSSLTREAFEQLDARTLGVAMHLFEIDQVQLTEVVPARLLLPGTLGGLALTPYCLAAAPAFLGCMMSVGRRLAIPVDEPQRFVPGFDYALEFLKNQLPDDEVPPPETFFPSSLIEDEPPQVSHLSRELLRAQQEKLHKELYDVATGPESAFLTVTSHKTCGDFLFAPLTDPYCRMARTFKTFTRLYLDLEVTSKVCNIGECNGTDVHPFGAHGYHAPGKITNRHHAIRVLREAAARGAQQPAGSLSDEERIVLREAAGRGARAARRLAKRRRKKIFT